METSQLLISLLLAVLLFWIIGAYNRLVGLRNAIGDAYAQIDVQLRRRHDLLPPIVAMLRPFVPAEQGALDAVLAASDQANAAAGAVRRRPGEAGAVSSLALAEQVLAGALARVHALLEGRPESERDEGLAASLGELSAIEKRLGFARQVFNEAALGYNHAVRQFPTRLLLPLFRFEPAGQLQR